MDKKSNKLVCYYFMYVAQGSITHCIEGKELVLHKGDVLMLNQQVVHSIKRAGYQDMGINFIALPEFFEVPLSMLGEENVLAKNPGYELGELAKAIQEFEE